MADQQWVANTTRARLRWFDTGTHESLVSREGFKIACLGEIAYRLGLIDIEQMVRLAKPLAKAKYGQSRL